MCAASSPWGWIISKNNERLVLLMKKSYKIEVDCANCAQKMEDAANTVAGVANATVSFMTQKMKVEFSEGADPHDTMVNVLAACKRWRTTARSLTSENRGANPLSHRCAVSALPRGRAFIIRYRSLYKTSPLRKDFPVPGQILPAPGRNVTAGDKERNRCRAATKRGMWICEAKTERFSCISVLKNQTVFNSFHSVFNTVCEKP